MKKLILLAAKLAEQSVESTPVEEGA